MISGDYMIYMGIIGVMSLIGMLVSNRLQSKAKKYGAIRMRSGITGREIAERMLRHYNVDGVSIVQGQGFLTDHYNPMSKTVSLSPAIYGGNSIMSAAVAAHEVGHAIQHDRGYAMLQVRSALVPFVNFSARIQQYVLMGAFMLAASGMEWIWLIAIVLFTMTALFSFVTLPVEFDATRRALVWLEDSGVSEGAEMDGARDALKWAAMTYVVAALSALVMVVYLVFRYMGSDR